jgi:hypothetical protein
MLIVFADALCLATRKYQTPVVGAPNEVASTVADVTLLPIPKRKRWLPPTPVYVRRYSIARDRLLSPLLTITDSSGIVSSFTQHASVKSTSPQESAALSLTLRYSLLTFTKDAALPRFPVVTPTVLWSVR